MRSTLLTAFCLLLIFAAQSSRIASGAQTQTQNRAADTPVARGRYLVEEVAKCSECHTPRDADMQLEKSQWLQGAPIWIQPSRHADNWAQFAPALSGFAYSDEQMEHVLEMGQGANGSTIQPPMHIYHLNHADARAIIAYLRSLRSPTVVP